MPIKDKQHNRLIHEKSPYLLQHANNPVDWYPWGEEAFAKAQKEDKPIFLSIGYSTCHWCHVMAHESFEDEEIAAKINAYFVPVKVDREERPDIDNIYMSAVTTMTGQGGWPLTVLLTPDKKPFWGGTYFSPQRKWGQPGLMDILESMHTVWLDQRSKVEETGESLTLVLQKQALKKGGDGELDPKVLQSAFSQFSQNYDSQWGGFGHSPKFPMGHNLSFLLRYWKRSGEVNALAMVEKTLEEMAKGGIYDHIGGGFHRYSTDYQWQVPHFEKMLYDQAILARAYLEVYQITRKERYAQTAREIFDYVLRDMQDKEGGFYSAEDADSFDPDEYAGMSIDQTQRHVKKEGAFYVWRQEEIESILGSEEAEVFNFYSNVKMQGNAYEDPHEEFTRKNIVYAAQDIKAAAQFFKRNESEISDILKRSREKLFFVRSQRPRPHLDDKILTDWNGLMIASLAFGAKVLKEDRYQEAAEKSAKFILRTLVGRNGRLQHFYRDNQSAVSGSIEDYAFFIYGLLDLYETTFKVEYLKEAVRLGNLMLDLFWDQEDGGFYFTAYDAEKLLFRQKEIYDGAIPSGNSVAALVLVRLSHMTLDKKWGTKLERLFAGFAQQITAAPHAYGQMLMALDFAFGPSKEVVLAMANKSDHVVSFHDAIYDYFIPNKALLLNDSSEIVSIAPFLKKQIPQKGRLTAYVCENHICKSPVQELESFRGLLK